MSFEWDTDGDMDRVNMNRDRNREALLAHLSACVDGYKITNTYDKLGNEEFSAYELAGPCLLPPDTSLIGGTIPYEYIFPSQQKATKRKYVCVEDKLRVYGEESHNAIKQAKYYENTSQEHIVSEQSQPMDLSNKQNTNVTEMKINHTFSSISHLRSILCGINSYNPINNNCELKRNTPVTLATKNLYPVTSRVASWLQDAIQVAKETPEFGFLCSNDQIALLNSSWAQQVVLYMAEHNFSFAVTVSCMLEELNLISIETPTMHSVQMIESFIKKCQGLSLTSEEYKLVRLSVLFNTAGMCSSPTEIESPAYIEESHYMYLKKLHVEQYKRHANKDMMYPQLLMLFPALYSINCKMVAQLFLCNISVELDTFFSDRLKD